MQIILLDLGLGGKTWISTPLVLPTRIPSSVLLPHFFSLSPIWSVPGKRSPGSLLKWGSGINSSGDEQSAAEEKNPLVLFEVNKHQTLQTVGTLVSCILLPRVMGRATEIVLKYRCPPLSNVLCPQALTSSLVLFVY